MASLSEKHPPSRVLFSRLMRKTISLFHFTVEQMYKNIMSQTVSSSGFNSAVNKVPTALRGLYFTGLFYRDAI